MHVIDRRAARTAARTLVVPAALAVLAATAPQAAAHTELETSSPGADAEVSGLPHRVTLTFSDAMTQKYAKVAVTAPDGEPAAAGDPQVAGKTVTLALKSGTGAGRFTVGYRVVSADGHPVSGSYSFTLKEASGPSPSARAKDPSAAAKAEASDSPASAEPAADQAASESFKATGSVLAGAGALVAIGAAAGAYLARRRRARHGD
ncbi:MULTISPECIES: copper resistance CopC family protein [unclassified Streptomyces]|uniref:copper resistance CopC family protein n=1 Tax=unclassified Streptomyces TaxID=2593676 RepID=UPI0033BE56DA